MKSRYCILGNTPPLTTVHTLLHILVAICSLLNLTSPHRIPWRTFLVETDKCAFTVTILFRTKFLAAQFRLLFAERPRPTKTKLDSTLIARNRWELTRCLEVVNLYDLGKLVFFAALARTESRGLHRRIDYPYTDPLYNGKILAIKRTADGPRAEWCDLPD